MSECLLTDVGLRAVLIFKLYTNRKSTAVPSSCVAQIMHVCENVKYIQTYPVHTSMQQKYASAVEQDDCSALDNNKWDVTQMCFNVINILIKYAR